MSFRMLAPTAATLMVITHSFAADGLPRPPAGLSSGQPSRNAAARSNQVDRQWQGRFTRPSVSVGDLDRPAETPPAASRRTHEPVTPDSLTAEDLFGFEPPIRYNQPIIAPAGNRPAAATPPDADSGGRRDGWFGRLLRRR